MAGALSVMVEGGKELKEIFWLFVVSVSTPMLVHYSSFISLCLPFFILCTYGLITYVLTSCFLQINLYFRNISDCVRCFSPKLTITHSVAFFVLGSSVFFFFNLNTFEVNPNTCLAFCTHIFWRELHLPWFHVFYRSFRDIYITIMNRNILLASRPLAVNAYKQGSKWEEGFGVSNAAFTLPPLSSVKCQLPSYLWPNLG